MSKLKYSVYILFLTWISVSCHRDPIDTYTDEELTTFTAQVYQEIESTLVGYIYDENNVPVENATVATYSTVTKTNEHGVFVMKNIKTDQQGTYIKVIKDGYILGSDFVYPLPGKISYAYVKLMKLDGSKSFESKNGGIINADNGGKIIFPADAIANNAGETYTGKVSVTAKYLHPNNNELGNVMPGGLIADAANGNTVVLGTLGMMAVELRGASGQKLNLKQGSQATIEFPAVTEYKPSTINLWYFDEAKGRWKEEGNAVLEGDKYVAKVSHFSFWNCDAPFPLIEVCGRVLYEDGTPVKNISVKVVVEGLNTGYGMTNEDGKFCGKMPKGKVYKIMISNFGCAQNIETIEVGPFQNNTQLNEIVIKKVKPFKIIGKLHCNNDAVKEGFIVTKVKDFKFVNLVGENGAFTIDLTSYTCGESIPVSIFGFDNENTNTSQVLDITSPPTSEISLNVCSSDCTFTADMVHDCKEKLEVKINGGSGNFTYKWEDNTTASFIEILPDSIGSKIYCLTVTDVTNACEKVFCKEVKPIILGIEVNCLTGQLEAITNTFVSYIWVNGGTTSSFKATNPGTYTVTVTNVLGCTATASANWSGTPYIDSKPKSCSKNTFQFESSFFDNGYYEENGTNNFGQLTFPISINIFQTGYNFTLRTFDRSCFIEDGFREQVKLPQLINGLATTVINTTCQTCSDGKININLNTNADCYECKIGQTKIFNINDLDTDLTTTNNNSNMAKGEYYVVVTDDNTGCYIAFKKVKIQ